MNENEAFLAAWHRIVAGRDLVALRDVLAEDVALGAPPYWNDFCGRELVHFLLGCILETIEDFTYHREWRDGNELALEFRGRVGEVELQGIDLITLDGDGKLRKLDVMIRPSDAVEALRAVVAPKMTAYLADTRT